MSKQMVQGTVEIISERPAGKGTAYGIKVNGDWYSHGFKKPECVKGDYVKFEWSANGTFKNIDSGTLEVVRNQPTAAPQVQVGISAKGASQGTDWDTKDRRITFLACRKDAIEITRMGLEQQAIKLGTKDKFPALLSTVRELTNDLFYNVYGEKFGTFDEVPEAQEFESVFKEEE